MKVVVDVLDVMVVMDEELKVDEVVELVEELPRILLTAAGQLIILSLRDMVEIIVMELMVILATRSLPMLVAKLATFATT